MIQKHLVTSHHFPYGFIENPVVICHTVTARYFVSPHEMTARASQFIQILDMNDFSKVLQWFFLVHIFFNVSEDELANNSEC